MTNPIHHCLVGSDDEPDPQIRRPTTTLTKTNPSRDVVVLAFLAIEAVRADRRARAHEHFGVVNFGGWTKRNDPTRSFPERGF